MYTLPNASPLHIVLETLIGGNPYDDDYPRNPIITFEIDHDETIHRIFFAIYDDRLGNFRAELRDLPRRWPKVTASGANISLHVKRYYDADEKVIKSETIRAAFLEVARAKFTGLERVPCEEDEEEAL